MKVTFQLLGGGGGGGEWKGESHNYTRERTIDCEIRQLQ